MYSSRCRYLVTILVVMIHDVSTSLKYYKFIVTSASSFIWHWYESYDYCETPFSAAPMPAWQVRALCAWPGSAQVDPSPCLRVAICVFSKRCRFFSVSKSAWNSLLGGCTHGLEILQLRSFGGHRRGWRSGGRYRGAKPTRQLPWERGRFLSFPKNVWNRKQV